MCRKLNKIHDENVKKITCKITGISLKNEFIEKAKEKATQMPTQKRDSVANLYKKQINVYSLLNPTTNNSSKNEDQFKSMTARLSHIFGLATAIELVVWACGIAVSSPFLATAIIVALIAYLALLLGYSLEDLVNNKESKVDYQNIT